MSGRIRRDVPACPQSVSQRRREFAMRAALGATRRDLLTMVFRDGFGMTAMGVGAGVVAGVLMFRVLRSFDAHVSVADGMAAIAALAILGVAWFVATALPAWRAATDDPVRVLRSQ